MYRKDWNRLFTFYILIIFFICFYICIQSALQKIEKCGGFDKIIDYKYNPLIDNKAPNLNQNSSLILKVFAVSSSSWTEVILVGMRKKGMYNRPGLVVAGRDEHNGNWIVHQAPIIFTSVTGFPGCDWFPIVARTNFSEPIRLDTLWVSAIPSPHISQRVDGLIKIPASAEPVSATFVCIQNPLYLMADWRLIIQAFELWRSLGIEKILYAASSIQVDVETVLNSYEKEGFTKKITNWGPLPFVMTKDFDPMDRAEDYGEQGLATSCIYYAYNSARYLIMMDLDEFLIPTEPNSNNLTEFLQSLEKQYPSAGCFNFKRVLAPYPHTEEDYNELSIDKIRVDYLQNLTVTPQRGGFRLGKKVVFPQRVLHANVHNATVRPGYKNVEIGKEFGWVYHMRRVPMASYRVDSGSSKSKYDTRLSAIVPKIHDNIEKFAKRSELFGKKIKFDREMIKIVDNCTTVLHDLELCGNHRCVKEVVKFQNPANWGLYFMKDSFYV